MHYKIDKVRRALKHFIIGKAATAFSAIALLLLLGKVLPKADYAIYVSMQAVILVVGALTSFGINQSLIRYAPELRATNNNLALYRRTFFSLGSRFAVIGLGLGFAWITQAWWLPRLNLNVSPELLLIYLGVGWARLVGLFLSRVMQSLLWQKLSQYVLGATSLLKLAIAGSLAYEKMLNLERLFWLELLIESLALLVLVLGLLRRWRADPRRSEGDVDWWNQQRDRVSTFARWAYLNGLTSVTYGSAPNRLIAARFLSPELTAIFGFADAMALLGKRFMPARLMHGMIKPVLIARFAGTGDFGDLNGKVNLNFRLNSVLLCAPIALLVTVGPVALDWVTSHKYGASAYVLAGLLVILLLDGFRAQLELVCEVVEKPRVALVGNLSMCFSLVAAIALVVPMGMWGIVAGAFFGSIIAIGVTAYGLRSSGFAFHGDILMLSPVLACCLAILAGLTITHWTSAGVVLSGLATAATYGLASLAWPALSHEDRRMLRRFGKQPRREFDGT